MKKSKSISQIVLVLFCSCIPQMYFTSCTENKAASIEPKKFQVTNPVLADTSVTSEYVADIHSLKNVELRARVKGYLEKIFVDEGEDVKEGQVLFSISKQEYVEALARAK